MAVASSDGGGKWEEGGGEKRCWLGSCGKGGLEEKEVKMDVAVTNGQISGGGGGRRRKWR